MKIKYSVSDNKVLEVQSHASHNIVAGPGEAIDDVQGVKDVIPGMTRIAAGQYRGKSKEEIDAEKEAEKIRKQERAAKKKAFLEKYNVSKEDLEAALALIEDRSED